jgi:P4 family phage/plasmid primase-like protien
MSALSPAQSQMLWELHEANPSADVAEVKRLMDDRFKAGRKGSVLWESLEFSVRQFYPLAVDPGKAVLYYRNGVWHRNGQGEISRLVIGLLGEDGTQPNAKKVIERIQATSDTVEGIGPRGYMNFRNGMLDLKTLELLPHSPDYGSTVQLLVDWNPTAKAPNFEAWLERTIDAELHFVIKQVIGATLFPGSPFHKSVALIGPGGNGKGTVERTIRKLLPPSAVSAIDIAELSTNRFAAADLYGATTNLCGDIQPFTIQNTAIFKKLTGEDVIRAERKFGQPFNFTSEAFLVFSGNSMPPSTDPSEGWARRWHIIPMERPIQGPFDSSIELNIQTREELEGIACLAVHALLDALRSHGFAEPPACRIAKDAYRRQCSSVQAFIEDALDFSSAESYEEPFAPRGLISATYDEYCRQTQCRRESNAELYSAMLRAGKDKVRNRSMRPHPKAVAERGFGGVRIRTEWRSLHAEF